MAITSLASQTSYARGARATGLQTLPRGLASEPERLLALRVVERALLDARGQCQACPEAQQPWARNDARHFLKVRLWEADNLWGQWLEPTGLSPRAVARRLRAPAAPAAVAP
jgi:hypothetical protein